MAKATATEKKVIEKVMLELSQEEAQFLMDVVGATITGDPLTSRRKFTDEIYHALSALGFEIRNHSNRDFAGQVEFKSEIKAYIG